MLSTLVMNGLYGALGSLCGGDDQDRPAANSEPGAAGIRLPGTIRQYCAVCWRRWRAIDLTRRERNQLTQLHRLQLNAGVLVHPDTVGHHLRHAKVNTIPGDLRGLPQLVRRSTTTTRKTREAKCLRSLCCRQPRRRPAWDMRILGRSGRTVSRSGQSGGIWRRVPGPDTNAGDEHGYGRSGCFAPAVRAVSAEVRGRSGVVISW